MPTLLRIGFPSMQTTVPIFTLKPERLRIMRLKVQVFLCFLQRHNVLALPAKCSSVLTVQVLEVCKQIGARTRVSLSLFACVCMTKYYIYIDWCHFHIDRLSNVFVLYFEFLQLFYSWHLLFGLQTSRHVLILINSKIFMLQCFLSSPAHARVIAFVCSPNLRWTFPPEIIANE